MSNLILPKDMINQVLENNLNALFTRYPHEKARLEEILRKPTPLIPMEDVELPAVPSKPPIRILLLCGLTSPKFLEKIANDPDVQRENFKLFIFENDPETAALYFQHWDLAQLINYAKTEWFICNDVNSVRPALFRALKPEGVTSMMLNIQILEATVPKSQQAKEFYDTLPKLYNETARHVLHNHGNLDDSLLGVDVTLRNKKWLLNAPGILDLKQHYKGMSAIVVGAGPSLDHHIEELKKYNDRFVVIAADASLKPLLAAGIRVDFVTSIERLNAYQKPFFENLGPTTAELIAFPVVHPDVLDIYPGPVRLAYRNYSFYAYFEKAYPKGIVRCGGSTSHLGVRLAEYFGCRKIFLLGLDSCYEEKNGKFRSHCSGTGHPDWAEFVDIKEFALNRRHQPPMTAVNNLGEVVTTNITYYQWVKEYSEELAYIGQRATIKNCSAKGLAIDGIPYIPLEEAAKNIDPMIVEKPVGSTAVYNRKWDNKEVVKNFEAWKKASLAGAKEANELLAMDTVDLNRYQTLIYLNNYRLIIDDMFVAFVIQCCAFKYFELENRWWSYDINPTQDLKEKVAVLKQRFELYDNVLDRLIDMFKKEATDGAK